MRAAVVITKLLTVALLLFSAPRALAQDDFDDEFDAEFEEPPPPPPADEPVGGFDAEFEEPPPEPPPQPADEFDAEFGGEEHVAEEGETSIDEVDEELDEDSPVGDDESDESGREETLEDRRFRLHNSLTGPVGGLHVIDAGSGPVDSFRVSLVSDFFFATSFLQPGDDHDHIGATLSLSWTPISFLEVFMNVASYANSNTAGDPQLFQVLGDAMLGVKGFHAVLPWLTVGGDLSIALLNTVGDIGLVFRSTSLGLRGNVSADLRELDRAIPLIARFNLQYFFDNSYNLVEDVERQRFNNLDDPVSPMENETRHLLTRVERFGLNINRTDFFNLALGVEAPIRITESFHVHPFLEWRWSIPVNRRGFSCLFVPNVDDPGSPAEGDDGCLDTEGAAAFPMDLTLGARVLPPVDGLALLVAADIGLTGKNTFVRELAGNSPYMIYLGVSFAYDTDPEPEVVIREVEREVEVAVPLALQGRVRGYAIEQGSGTPVAGARIELPGRDLTALVSAEDGTFLTYPLEPGEVQLGLTHPDYHPASCVATIPDERPEEGELVVEVRCELAAARIGEVRGQVTSPDGTPIIAAQVQLSGPGTHTATTNATGNFSLASVPGGSYLARVSADGYLTTVQRVEVRPRETIQADLILVQRPRDPGVVVRGSNIVVRRRIGFQRDTDQLDPRSIPALVELADLLMNSREIRLVEIQGHTDNVGNTQGLVELSRRRADAVRDWLIDHGVEASRLTTEGFGGSRPIVPNITAGNRARNNRIQFVIQE